MSSVSVTVPDLLGPEVSAERFLIYPAGELDLERDGKSELLARRDGLSTWYLPERHCGGALPLRFSSAEGLVIAYGEEELFSGHNYSLYNGDSSGTSWTDKDVVLVQQPTPSTYIRVAIAEQGRWQIIDRKS